MAPQSKLDQVISLAKRRGFVFQAGEIYGGSRSAWDYGPLGTELKENIKREWWQTFVRGREDMVGLDSSIILPKAVWEASGHVATFTDPLVECTSCHKRHREDHLIEAFVAKKNREPVGGMSEIACPDCGTKGQFTEPQLFSGLVKTFLGPVDSAAGMHFMRPETAQGIFVNFNNVLTVSRKKPPFGIGQIGKAFRNEITPGNFIFRTREFEQMEIEFFTAPEDADRRSSRSGSRTAGTGSSTWASAKRTCAASTFRRTSVRTTRPARSTSSTASASRAPSGASSWASPTAPTTT